MVCQESEKGRHKGGAHICACHLDTDYALGIFCTEIIWRGVDNAGIYRRTAKTYDHKADLGDNAHRNCDKCRTHQRQGSSQPYHFIVPELVGNKARKKSSCGYANKEKRAECGSLVL